MGGDVSVCNETVGSSSSARINAENTNGRWERFPESGPASGAQQLNLAVNRAIGESALRHHSYLPVSPTTRLAASSMILDSRVRWSAVSLFLLASISPRVQMVSTVVSKPHFFSATVTFSKV